MKTELPKIDANILKRARMYLTKNSKHEQNKQQRLNYAKTNKRPKETNHNTSKAPRLVSVKLLADGFIDITPNEKP